jgi:hypothetical protein
MLVRMIGHDGAPWQMRLVMREIMEPTKACEEMVHEAFRPYFEILLGILRQMLPDDVPPHTVNQLGFSVIGQCVYYRVSEKIVSMLVTEDELALHFAPQQLARHITRVTLAAIGATPPFGASATDPAYAALPSFGSNHS